MKNLRKRISEGDASPELLARQKEIAKKSNESKKAKRAKEKTEYQEAIANRDSLLLELNETKQKLADAEFNCEGLMSVNKRYLEKFKSLSDVSRELDEMLKAVWNWR